MSTKHEIDRLLGRMTVSDDELRALGGGAVRGLIARFASDESADRDAHRRLIVRALGLLGTPRAVEFLIEVAQDPGAPTWLRGEAMRALGDTDAPKAVRFLVEWMGDGDELERKNAVLALARCRGPRAHAALDAAARDDSSPAVRRAAAGALGRVTPAPQDVHHEKV